MKLPAAFYGSQQALSIRVFDYFMADPAIAQNPLRQFMKFRPVGGNIIAERDCQLVIQK